ncbi:MAG: CoA enzyme activase [Dehalococcoidales bacterium]|nr:CoA enzyme activase [Dehalococcoidales bacterium]
MGEAIVCGVDVGSRMTKAVIMAGSRLLAASITPTEVDSVQSARCAIEQALQAAGLAWENLGGIVATGYGRLRLPFAHFHITEITCHARGAFHLFPEVRTVLDIGGQDCKAIRLGANGRVVSFLMNDKCAAGTGRCLERIGAAVGIPLPEVGPMSLATVKEPLRVDTFCAIFAQMDVLALVNEGKTPSDILAAVLDGYTARVWGLLERVGIQPELCMTGGVAKNTGIVKRIETRLGQPVKIASDPQIVGALGAALIAQDKLAIRVGTAPTTARGNRSIQAA